MEKSHWIMNLTLTVRLLSSRYNPKKKSKLSIPSLQIIILSVLISIALSSHLRSQDIDTLKYYTPPFEGIPVLLWFEEHAIQFTPNPRFQLLEVLLMATLNDTARVFLREDSAVIIPPDSIFHFPGESFFDTLVTLSAPVFLFDVVNVRDYHMLRENPFWVVVRHGGEGIPFNLDKPEGNNRKVDLTSSTINGDYDDWGFTGAIKSIAILIDRDPVGIEGNYDSVLYNDNASILFQNYPNPANPRTIIPFHLVVDSNIKISIFNSRGKLVNIIFDGFIRKGYHEIIWNGKNIIGEEVPSGIYYYKMQEKSMSTIKKMVILK